MARRRAAALEEELSAVVSAARDANLDDEHDVEGPSVAFERQRVASLLAAARVSLHALEAAAERLSRGETARCEECGRPMGAARLQALPATTRCVACASGEPSRCLWSLSGGSRRRR